MSKNRVDWQSWNKINDLLCKNTLMRGEENSLTEIELEALNKCLLTMASEVDTIRDIANNAKARFAENCKK